MVSLSVPTSVSAFLSLLLAAGMGLLGVALGERLLDLLGVRPSTSGERLVLAGGLGLGCLSYGFLVLGLVGLLHPLAIWAMLALAAVWSWPQVRRWPARWREEWGALRPPGFFERLGATLVIAMLVIVLIRGLAPVTDYDGLAYHLVIPRDYLQAGRIVPYPGEAHGNFPLVVDMLYIPAILLGLEPAAKLIHLGFGVLLGLGVYLLARRLLGSPRGGWLALLVLATTPVIGTVGGYAHTDLGWTLFEFLAAYALLCWGIEKERRWLVLAGIFAGLGMGSKYLGLATLGALGIALLVQSGLLARRLRTNCVRWRDVFIDGLSFGLVALAVAAPWYLKNWLWLGNPFYPSWFGGRGWDAYQSANLQFMGTGYGPRRGVLGLLLLPVDLFLYPIGYFGPIPFAFPTPLSLLLPLYLLVRRRTDINLILLIAVIRFGTWTTSARNARYLIDISPLLSVAIAYMLMELARKRQVRRIRIRVLIQGIVFVLLVGNLAWQALVLVQEGPIPVVLGLESREHYLAEHNQPPYQAIRFINGLPPGSRVFFVGNGQRYYVTVDHVADVSHGNWGHLVYQWG
jgi:4-amino-4-deoxy-L-arabinose transferase-like glycosyltransferase